MFAGRSPSQTSLIYLLLSLLFLFEIWRTSLPRSPSSTDKWTQMEADSHGFPSLHRYCVWGGVLANTKCGRKKSTWNVCYGNPLTTPRLMSIDSEHTCRELPFDFTVSNMCGHLLFILKGKKVLKLDLLGFWRILFKSKVKVNIIVFTKQQRKWYSNFG